MSDKPKILVVDTYYPQFLNDVLQHLPMGGHCSYDQALEFVLQQCFGTFDAYSRGLRSLGWDAVDVIANSSYLQTKWILERNANYHKLRVVPDTLYVQIDHYRPDVLFMQNLSLIPPHHLAALREDFWLAGQLSCPWPGDEIVREYDVLFTSFPHYLPRFVDLGVKAVWLPLAFDHEVHHRLLARDVRPDGRNINVSFAGGMTPQFGRRRAILEQVLKADIPHCYFMGYGGPGDPLWGLDMYKLYGKSKIVLNIHHPAADGFSNNLRMFEATGMGALLLTEASDNIQDYFRPQWECATYTSAEDAINKIRFYLEHWDIGDGIAKRGQQKTLTHHTYNNRMPIVDEVLRGLVL